MKKAKYAVDSSDEANNNTEELNNKAIKTYKQLIDSEEEEEIGPSNSNLKYHLEDDHNDIYLKHWKPSLQRQKAQQNNTQSQSKISNFIQKLPRFSQEKLNQLIAEYISQNMKPYTTVVCPEFINIIQYLEPTSTIPSPYILTNKLIPQQYEKIKESITKEINSQQNYGLSVTTDIWTAVNNKSFITATIHFIDSNFQSQTRILSTVEIVDNHTAENMLKKLILIFNEFKVQYDSSILRYKILTHQVQNKIMQDEKQDLSLFNQKFPLFITTDQASNNVKAFKTNFKIPHLYCYAHMIHNILEKLKDQNNNEYEDILSKIKIISKIFRKSQRKFKQLSEIQIMKKINPPLKLKLDIPTRWGSTFAMIERFEILQKCLQAYQVQYENEIEELNNFKYNMLKDLVQFLKPFSDIIIVLSKRNENSVTKIIKFIETTLTKYLKVNISDQEFIKQLKQSMNTNFTEEMNSSILNRSEKYIYFAAAYLHPRTKKFDMLCQEQIKSAKDFIQYYYTKLLTEFQIQKYDGNTQKNYTSLHQNVKYDVFGFEYYEDKMEISKNIEFDEINMYENHFFSPTYLWQSFNLLDWWKTNQEMYPILSKMARIFLNIQITSVESERVFSKAGGIYNNKRANLKKKNITTLQNPPNNSDLNSIEFVWSILKRQVEKSQPKNEESLSSCIMNCWESIPQSQIQSQKEVSQVVKFKVLYKSLFEKPVTLRQKILKQYRISLKKVYIEIKKFEDQRNLNNKEKIDQIDNRY
ncbi:hypothetical protein ABPG72_013996 [Tetrahymena utriculariae]